MIDTSDQKKLIEFLERRHPTYEDNEVHWKFLEDCYDGGREWFVSNIFKYLREGDEEYADRVERAYRFNHSREIVDLVNKYIFKQDANRNDKDASPAIKTFWHRAGRNGGTIRELMWYASARSSIFGRSYLVIDSNRPSDLLTVADEKAAGVRVYGYIVPPHDMLDISFDDNGGINWALVRENYRDDVDPLGGDGNVKDRFRLWSKDDWQLFEITEKGKKKTVTMVASGVTNLGMVPIVPIDHTTTEAIWDSPSLIGDIAYLDRAVANYCSNLDAIIQDQTFSQLTLPGQSVMPGEDTQNTMMELGTKRIFVFNGEHGAKPEYISPDPKQAQVILQVINKIISEIYHTVGMAGERTKQDNAVGIDNSSGVAKAYDFERMNALLVTKASALARAENKVIELVCAWMGEKKPKEDLVQYPESFDVRGIYDEFEIATNLALLEAPEEVRREQMRLLVEKIFPRLSKDLRDKIEINLKSWPPEPIEIETPGLGAAPKENRQGQVVE